MKHGCKKPCRRGVRCPYTFTRDTVGWTRVTNEGTESSVAKLVAPPQPLSLRDRSPAPAASSAAAAAASSQVARKDLG